MYTVTFSAGGVFAAGIFTGLIIGAVGLVILALSLNKKK